MLEFTLKKEWYDKIKRGEKTIEYREVKPYWRQRMKKILPPCFYSNMKKNYLYAKMREIKRYI